MVKVGRAVIDTITHGLGWLMGDAERLADEYANKQTMVEEARRVIRERALVLSDAENVAVMLSVDPCPLGCKVVPSEYFADEEQGICEKCYDEYSSCGCHYKRNLIRRELRKEKEATLFGSSNDG